MPERHRGGKIRRARRIVGAADRKTGAKPAHSSAMPAGFHLMSADIAKGVTMRSAQVFNGFGCTGQNISPAIMWHNAPAGTKSYALMMYDPDAPTGSGWWHSVVYNIPATVSSLPAGAGTADGAKLPAGAKQGATDFGTLGDRGPCPPTRAKPHRYSFRVHALKVDKIDVPENATAALIGYNVNANTRAVAEIMARYGR